MAEDGDEHASVEAHASADEQTRDATRLAARDNDHTRVGRKRGATPRGTRRSKSLVLPGTDAKGERIHGGDFGASASYGRRAAPANRPDRVMPTGLVAGARVEPAAVASPVQRAARDRAKRLRFRWILAACVGGSLVIVAAVWAAASWVGAGG